MYIIVVASVKTGFYYAMKKNNGTVEDFKKRLLQIVNHYQVLVCVIAYSTNRNITSYLVTIYFCCKLITTVMKILIQFHLTVTRL